MTQDASFVVTARLDPLGSTAAAVLRVMSILHMRQVVLLGLAFDGEGNDGPEVAAKVRLNNTSLGTLCNSLRRAVEVTDVQVSRDSPIAPSPARQVVIL